MQGLEYNVDIVMCIDCTGSMGGLLEKVKTNALRFYSDVKASLDKKSKSISSLRVKVIAFRDYYCDGDGSMLTTDFMSLPERQSDFSDFVSKLRAEGGGDEPENGLEALALAMQSDWATSGDRKRHIIVMWTDASAHELEKNSDSKPSNYPTDIPKNFDEITDTWEDEQGGTMPSSSARRLLLFAPDAYPWTDIANNWELTIQYASKAGDGLEDIDYDVISVSYTHLTLPTILLV